MSIQGPNGNNLKFKGVDGKETSVNLSNVNYVKRDEQNESIFKRMDKDNSGVVDQNELNNFMQVGGRDQKVTAKDFHESKTENQNLFRSLQQLGSDIEALNVTNNTDGTHTVVDKKNNETRVYDNNNKLQSTTTTQTNADKTSVETTEDAQGRVIDVVNKDASGKITSSISKEYDENGNVKSQTETKPDNTSVVTRYAEGKPTESVETFKDGCKTEKTFDANGRVTQDVRYDANGAKLETHSFTYDDNGNITGETIDTFDGDKKEITYENGKPKTAKLTNKKTPDWSYTETFTEVDGKMTSVRTYNNGQKKECSNFDELGNARTQTVKDDKGNVLWTGTYKLSSNGNTISLHIENADKTTEDYSDYKNGNATKIIKKDAEGKEISTKTNEFDEKGNLISSTEVNADSTTTIKYDDNGNIISKQIKNKDGTEKIIDGGNSNEYSRELVTKDGKKQMHVDHNYGDNKWDATFDVNDDGSYGYTVKKGETINTVAKHILALYGIDNPSKEQLKEVTAKLMENTKVYTMKKGKHRGAKYYLAGQQLKIPTAEQLGIKDPKPMQGVTTPAATDAQKPAEQTPAASGQQQAAKTEPQAYSLQNDEVLIAAEKRSKELMKTPNGGLGRAELNGQISEYKTFVTSSWKDGQEVNVKTSAGKFEKATEITLNNGQRALKIGDAYYPINIDCTPDMQNPITDKTLIPAE